MAAHQFASASKVSPSRVVRRFSVEQANRALPYVKRIVADLIRVSERIAELDGQAVESPDAAQASDLQRRLREAAARQKELLQELTAVGVEAGEPRTGQVRFVGRHKGRDVYLNWTLGEDRITHWYEVNASAAASQPVATLQETE